MEKLAAMSSKKRRIGKLCAKNSLLMLSCAFFTPAYAIEIYGKQLQLYGSAVNGIAYVDNVNGKNDTKFLSGLTWSSYIGLAGTTEITPDLSVVYNISRTYDMNSGDTWPGVSYVGLSSPTYGTLTMGRQYDYTNDLVPISIVSSNTRFAFHPGGYDRAHGIGVKNTLAYTSPRYNGTEFKAMYGRAETDETKDSYSVTTNYQNEKLKAALIYTSIGGGIIAPGLEAGMSHFFGNYLGDDRSLVIPLEKTDILAAAINFKQNKITYKGAFTSVKFHSTENQTDKINNIEASVLYELTPKVLLNLGYTHSYASDDQKWDTLSTSIDYSLAKSADIMLILNHQKASGNGQVASLFSIGNSEDDQQTALSVAFRYFF